MCSRDMKTPKKLTQPTRAVSARVGSLHPPPLAHGYTKSPVGLHSVMVQLGIAAITRWRFSRNPCLSPLSRGQRRRGGARSTCRGAPREGRTVAAWGLSPDEAQQLV